MTIDCRWAGLWKGVSWSAHHPSLSDKQKPSLPQINLKFSTRAEGLWKCCSRYMLPDLRVIYSSEEMAWECYDEADFVE